MTTLELTEIVHQRMADPSVLGRLACNLRSSEFIEQRHHDDRELSLVWEDMGDSWRCTIYSKGKQEHRIVQVDIHENNTIRLESYEPCRVTISPEEGILCLTRYKPQ
ncbi:MAG: hypothetical protein ABI142_10865 [Bryocella sp.]